MEHSSSSPTQRREGSSAEQAELGSCLARLHLGAAHGAAASAASGLSWPATPSQPQAFLVHVQSGWSELSGYPCAAAQPSPLLSPAQPGPRSSSVFLLLPAPPALCCCPPSRVSAATLNLKQWHGSFTKLEAGSEEQRAGQLPDAQYVLLREESRAQYHRCRRRSPPLPLPLLPPSSSPGLPLLARDVQSEDVLPELQQAGDSVSVRGPPGYCRGPLRWAC
jgi:hypothetical protein